MYDLLVSVYYIYKIGGEIVKVASVNSVYGTAPAFQAKTNDAHVYLGRWGEKNYGIDKLDKFVKTPIDVYVNGVKAKDTIEKMIVASAYVLSDQGNTADEIVGNEELLKMIEGRKEYVPIAVCQPNKTMGDTSKIEKLFNKHPKVFKGLQFHATALPLANDGDLMKAYEPYIKFAEKKKLPCYFHCQGGQAGAWPIYELAQKAPKLPVILGHSGSKAGEGNSNRENALKVFEDSLKTKKANIYMELSWVDWSNQGFPSKDQPDVKRILKIAHDNNGLDKVLFGTDAPLGCFGEWESPHFNNRTCYSDAVSSVKQTISDLFGKEADSVTDKVFYKNVEKLYTDSPLNKVNKLKSVASKKTAGIVAAGVVVVGSVATAIREIKENNSSQKSRLKHPPRTR